MKRVFESVGFLDEKAVKELGLDEKILMENAASKIEREIRKNLKKGSKILALCGGGNNGAGGLCALRKLSGDYECYAFLTSENLNENAKFQLQVARKSGVKITNEILKANAYIDAIFGSGLNRAMHSKIVEILNTINERKGLKIAVDIPSGINFCGEIYDVAFRADITVCMGAYKISLFSDAAKEYIGSIKVANLGICRDVYETKNAKNFRLEKSDLVLPHRKIKNSNKSTFGHVFVVCGEMHGAAQMSALAANAIGAGLVSVVSKENLNLQPFLMQKPNLENSKVVCAGMGLGKCELNLDELKDKICVIDADLCYKDEILTLLKSNKNIVITPHPKEFCALLKIAKIADIGVEELQKNRFKYAKMWSENFECVLVLKGANTLIAKDGEIFICDYGTAVLSKGGSGDVLAGLIAGYLAQNFTLLQSAINGVLAHAFAGLKCHKNSYGVNALDLIEEIKWL